MGHVRRPIWLGRRGANHVSPLRRLTKSAEVFDPRGRPLAVGRSLLALAELTVLLFSRDDILFGSTPNGSYETRCTGVGSASLWCVFGSSGASLHLASIVAVVILAGVLIGFQPKLLCVPHWYVAFSFATRTSVISGGEEVAQILALLLIPCCLGDRRVWQWSRPREAMAPAWRGSAYAAVLILRCQISGIYLEAALSKLAHNSWQHGSAMPAILLGDPEFALTGHAHVLAERVLASGWVGAASSWGVIVLELVIGIAALGPLQARRWGLALTVLLHCGIIVTMGLFSFGLIMMAAVTVTTIAADPRLVARADAPDLSVPAARRELRQGVSELERYP
jgi:antimicrobial peptide system SdpB family protein